MDETLEKIAHRPRPTTERPLLGTTVLAVEDSRFASEALRLMCLRSGARIRRADSLRAAARHLRTYLPTVAIVDLGLPDGSGLDLIANLALGNPRIPVVLATSGDTGAEAGAKAAGADAFLAKPVSSLAMFQETILGHLPPASRPKGPRPLPMEELAPDPIAMRDDLAHAARILDRGADGQTLDYVAQFIGGVAISARDNRLLHAARGLDASRHSHGAAKAAVGTLTRAIRERLETGAMM